MKKDIKLLQIEIQNDKQMFEDYGERVHFDNNIVSAIKNLINKYKELEEQINLTEKVQQNYKNAFYEKSIENTKLRDKIAEQEKIIKLMAKDIAENKLDEDICSKVRNPEKEECDCYADMYDACYGCVIEYYEKKARASND